MKVLLPTKRSDLKEIRKELLIKQDWKCKICSCELKEDKNSHVDHMHYGDELIRGVLCRRCNSLEGKFYNNYKRLTKTEDKSQEDILVFLKGLAKYYTSKPTSYIYPKKTKRVKKRTNFNKKTKSMK